MKKIIYQRPKILISSAFLGFTLGGLPSYATDPTWGYVETRGDLYYMRDQEILRGDDISKINAQLIEEIRDFESKTPGRAHGVTLAQAEKIQRLIAKNPVVGNNYKYDPQGVLGFCFGRALFAHLELLRHGVAKDVIKKAFVVGPMKTGSTLWQFHVATLVKAKDTAGWYVLDTNLSGPKTLDKWFGYYSQYSSDKKLRLYITEAQKLGPNAWEYNIRQGGLFDPFYNNYFKDMFAYFKNNQVAPEEKFIPLCRKVF